MKVMEHGREALSLFWNVEEGLFQPTMPKSKSNATGPGSMA